jgi:ketosteroid isomerase-like protein
MSLISSAVVRIHFSAFESGGLDAVAEFWHPEIEWRAVEGAADDIGVICGHDALHRYYLLDRHARRPASCIIRTGRMSPAATTPLANKRSKVFVC